MAILSTPLTSKLLSSPFLKPPLHSPHLHTAAAVTFKTHHKTFTISAIIIPGSSSNPPPSNQKLYQPFRPPPSPLPPKFRSLDTASRLEVLTNRLGLWFEYAPLITALVNEGFTPATLEEITGISGAEQNRLVVGAQVRETLVESELDPEILGFFETGGAELLYEIRLLNTKQRAASARYIVENKLNAKGAQELARSIKDYPTRRGDKGWERFDYTSPGDCLSFMYYRLSREHRNPSEQRTSALQQALSVAETEKARETVLEELQGKGGDSDAEQDETDDGVRVPVVRMKFGEVADASSVVVLPVCRAEEREKEVVEAPWECSAAGEFGVVVAERGWQRWVVLPAWQPMAGLGNGAVVVAFPDATILPWKVNRTYNDEAILVVADRERKEVAFDNGFYLVAIDGGELKVERGVTLKENGVNESLGTVVLVVRPPRDETDELSDEDWD